MDFYHGLLIGFIVGAVTIFLVGLKVAKYKKS